MYLTPVAGGPKYWKTPQGARSSGQLGSGFQRYPVRIFQPQDALSNYRENRLLVSVYAVVINMQI